MDGCGCKEKDLSCQAPPAAHQTQIPAADSILPGAVHNIRNHFWKWTPENTFSDCCVSLSKFIHGHVFETYVHR